MDFDILKVLSYTVVVITILTMVFGIVAYAFYKIREKRRSIANANNIEVKEKDKYLYFEEKEMS